MRRPRRGRAAARRARSPADPHRAAARADERVDREQVEPSDERRPAPLVLGVRGGLRPPEAGPPSATVTTQHSASTSSRACSATSRSISSQRFRRLEGQRGVREEGRQLPRQLGLAALERGGLLGLGEPALDHLERGEALEEEVAGRPGDALDAPPRPRRRPAPTASASWWATARSSTLSCRPTASRASSYATRSEASRRVAADSRSSADA